MRKVTMMAAAAVALVAGSAQAQIAARSNAPMAVSADQSDFLTQECRAIWKGDVEVLQARTRLRAQVLNVYQTKKGDECGETERLVADGKVFYAELDRRIAADHAVYTAGSDTITLTGNVVVVQGQNVARAEKVIINLTTGQSQLFAGTKGRGSKNRVRGLFYPNGKPN